MGEAGQPAWAERRPAGETGWGQFQRTSGSRGGLEAAETEAGIGGNRGVPQWAGVLGVLVSRPSAPSQRVSWSPPLDPCLSGSASLHCFSSWCLCRLSLGLGFSSTPSSCLFLCFLGESLSPSQLSLFSHSHLRQLPSLCHTHAVLSGCGGAEEGESRTERGGTEELAPELGSEGWAGGGQARTLPGPGRVALAVTTLVVSDLASLGGLLSSQPVLAELNRHPQSTCNAL